MATTCLEIWLAVGVTLLQILLPVHLISWHAHVELNVQWERLLPRVWFHSSNVAAI